MDRLKANNLWREASQLAFILFQLGLLLIVLRQFQIESNAFLRVAVLAFGGFVIHHFLPLRFRLLFFSLLSIAGITIILGPVTAAWLLGLGGVLIAICHLPASFRTRTILLVLVGLSLAAARADWVAVPWSTAIWPILGSMFMFRLMVYMYDISHDDAPFSLARTVSYFFMLPNVCFPLFPVVDYKTFRRNYYDADPHTIYQTGVEWMTRGVVHLILYRLVYYYLTLSPAEVARPQDFAQFALTTFLLYLRISGQFHLIVGMLYLFGFRLPETHHRYYLASSFTDFWRRINIYWKDFMMKVFYYPVYFRLRSKGTTFAVVLSTLVVFFATWVLHAYQWFWLRGSVLLTAPDITFWSVLAVLVIINSLYELKHGRQRTLTKGSFNLTVFVKKAACTAATFVVICALWSLWNTETLAEWVGLWESMANLKYTDLGLLSIVGLAAVVIGGVAEPKKPASVAKVGAVVSFGRTPVLNVVLLLALAAAGIQEVYTRLGPDAATIINSLRSGRLSRLDVASLERGYYENLNRVERFNSQLWELYMNRPASWLDNVGSAGLERFTGNFAQKELVSGFEARTNFGPIRTNRWGMRDRDYEQNPALGTFRIAMLGASSVMGWGVGDDDTFESIVERRLNAERPEKGIERYEILNFASPGYTPLQQMMAVDKALSFQPTTLFYVAAAREPSTATSYLAEVANKNVEVPYDFLKDILAKAGVPAGTERSTAMRRLFPFRNEIVGKSYEYIVAKCRERQISPVFVFLPQVETAALQEETPDMLRLAKDAGFIVWDFSDVFASQPVASVRLAEWDDHPNAKGHQLVASRLYKFLTDHAAEIFRPRI
jgi:hypothetical protein